MLVSELNKKIVQIVNLGLMWKWNSLNQRVLHVAYTVNIVSNVNIQANLPSCVN